MKRILYVDFENVSSAGLTGMSDLTTDDEVKIFLGPKCSKMSLIEADNIFHGDATVELIKNDQIAKNALDFIIMVHLGYDVAKKAGDLFFIISNDKGYDPAIHEMQVMTGETIARYQDIAQVIKRNDVKPGLLARLFGRKKVETTDDTANATEHEVLKKGHRSRTNGTSGSYGNRSNGARDGYRNGGRTEGNRSNGNGNRSNGNPQNRSNGKPANGTRPNGRNDWKNNGPRKDERSAKPVEKNGNKPNNVNKPETVNNKPATANKPETVSRTAAVNTAENISKPIAVNKPDNMNQPQEAKKVTPTEKSAASMTLTFVPFDGADAAKNTQTAQHNERRRPTRSNVLNADDSYLDNMSIADLRAELTGGKNNSSTRVEDTSEKEASNVKTTGTGHSSRAKNGARLELSESEKDLVKRAYAETANLGDFHNYLLKELHDNDRATEIYKAEKYRFMKSVAKASASATTSVSAADAQPADNAHTSETPVSGENS